MQFQKVSENNFSMYYTSCLLPPAWCATKKIKCTQQMCASRGGLKIVFVFLACKTKQLVIVKTPGTIVHIFQC